MNYIFLGLLLIAGFSFTFADVSHLCKFAKKYRKGFETPDNSKIIKSIEDFDKKLK